MSDSSAGIGKGKMMLMSCRDRRYLTSNVNITVADEDGESMSVPVGARYRKFRTAQ